MAYRIIERYALTVSLLVLTILVAAVPHAEQQSNTPAPPLHIVSDRMVLDEQGGIIIFEGHVTAKRADVTLTCRKLTIYGKKGSKFSPTDSGNNLKEQIDRIEAEDDVRIVQGDKVASSEKAIYYLDTQRIMLTGNPIVVQGKDSLAGQIITLDLKTGKSIVEGGREKPVEVILHPSGTATPGAK